MSYVALAAATAVLALVFRGAVVYAHRGFYRQGFAGDSSVHFVLIRRLRDAPRARYVEQFLIRPTPMSYPTAYHRFCGLFPLAMIERRAYLPNLVLFVLAAAGFVAYFRYLQTDLLGDARWQPLAIATAVFFCAPTNWVFSGPSYAYIMLSERLIGRISSAAFVLFAVVASAIGDTPSAALAVAAATLALISAIFARQLLCFVTPLLALLLLSVGPLAELAVALLCALLLSRAHFLRGLKQTVLQWRDYARHTKRSPAVRGSLIWFPDWRWLWEVRFHPREFLRRALQYEPARSILRYPEITLAFGLSVAAALTQHGSLRAVALGFAAAIVAAIVVYVATTTERLNHLGESYRYLEYGLYFIAPAAAGLFADVAPTSVPVIGFAWFVLATLAAPWFAYRVFSRWPKWPERDFFGDFLREMDLPTGAVIFPIGVQVAGDVCARRSDAKSFWWQPGSSLTEEIFREFIEELPFLKRDAGSLIEKYGVTHAICDKSVLQVLRWPLRLPGMQRYAENERFIGFRRVGSAGAAVSEFVGEILYPPNRGAA
jgi:hypothetical protein